MEKLKKRSAANRAPELTDFEAWGKRLRRAFKKASAKVTASESTIRQRKSALNIFKVCSYQYLRQLKRANLIGSLREFVRSRDPGRWKRNGDRDEFWVLRLATVGEQTDKKRKTRSRLAAELGLADLNDVRPELLLGFLYEAGPEELIIRDAQKKVRYGWADCYRAKAAPARVSAQPKTKVSRKTTGGWSEH